MSKPVILSDSRELLTRDGLTDTIAPWEDGLRSDTGRGSFEWWYFDAHFEDGSTAVTSFITKPLLERNGPLKPALALTITRPDGTKVSQFPIFPASQFSASSEFCNVCIGPNWVKGDLHQYQVHIEMKDLAADLSFQGIVPPWRPGAGKAYFGDLDHYFAWLPSIPYGTVEGTLTYDGQTHIVKGTGYHDHNWGNVGLNDVMDHWYWGRAHIGEYTLIFVEQIASSKYGYTRIPVFMFAKGNQILISDSRPLTMHTHEIVPRSDGHGYPRAVDFDWVSGNDAIRLRLRQPELIEAVSLLALLPKWQQKIARLFTNPYYFRFNADLELEINWRNIAVTERGPTLYEIMILQGKRYP